APGALAAHEGRVLLPRAHRRDSLLCHMFIDCPLTRWTSARRAARERDAGGFGGYRRHPLPGPGRGRQRRDGGARRRALRPLRQIRQPGGLPVHVHGHDGDHGRRRGEGHAGGARRRRRDLHRAAGGVARAGVLAVADAALRHFARPRAVLPAAGHRPVAAHGLAEARVSAEPSALEVHDLAVRFGGVTALGGVTFAVRPATVTSLIGPNGAGKTTAFNVITGFQRPTGGGVRHDGTAITGWRPHRIAKRRLVRTFQKTSLFPGLSVREDVLTGLHLRGRVDLLAALVQI